MFDIAKADDGSVLLTGRFDAAQADKAKGFLEDVDKSCVIDMKDLDYISSAGLGVLLATYKRLDELGQTMILRNMNKHIRRIFQVSRLDRVFTIE